MSTVQLAQLIDQYSGMVYCEELERYILAVEDNDVFYDYLSRHGVNLVVEMLLERIPPQAFVALRDALFRNATSETQKEVAINDMFVESDSLSYLMRCGSVETLRVFAEIIPNFDEEVAELNEPTQRARGADRSLVFNIWVDDIDDGDHGKTPDFLEKIDFLVKRFGVDVLNSTLQGGGTVFRMIDKDFMYWAPYIVKWVRMHPRLLSVADLNHYRGDLTRMLEEEEVELGFSIAQSIEDEESLAHAAATVVGNQTHYLSRRRLGQ